MSWNRLLEPPYRPRGRAWFMTVLAGSSMLVATVLAVVRFDEPAVWVPLLGLSQYPFWRGVYSLRRPSRRVRQETTPPVEEP